MDGAILDEYRVFVISDEYERPRNYAEKALVTMKGDIFGAILLISIWKEKHGGLFFLEKLDEQKRIYLEKRRAVVLKKICLLKQLLPNDILQHHIIPLHETLCERALELEILNYDPLSENTLSFSPVKEENTKATPKTQKKRLYPNRKLFSKPERIFHNQKPRRINQPRK